MPFRINNQFNLLTPKDGLLFLVEVLDEKISRICECFLLRPLRAPVLCAVPSVARLLLPVLQKLPFAAALPICSYGPIHNHEIEVLHDPTHVRSYTTRHWQELFAANGLEVVACENRSREFPAGLTVKRWCEVGNSGHEALQSIRDRLEAAPAEWLAELEIVKDSDGEFCIPVRTLLIIGRKPL